MHLFVGLASLAFCLLTSSALSSENPVGEKAYYKLDRDRARTSSLLSSGTFDVTVIEHVPNDSKGPAFRNLFNYDVKVQFYGRQKGDGKMKLPAELYTEEFLEKLRKDEVVTTERFTIKHLGIEDVTTASGVAYENADIVLIYDVDTSINQKLSALTESLLGKKLYEEKGHNYSMGLEDMKDLKIKAALVPDIPVVGAAKVDLSGVYKGIRVKAGFDHVKSKK